MEESGRMICAPTKGERTKVKGRADEDIGPYGRKVVPYQAGGHMGPPLRMKTAGGLL